ncbi:hypothetical protein CTZ27_25535 [Streptomyces griseocarneus]|nr:hypothetical protein CTZ27_25535 [Streptomyces griseocarneus]
MPGRVVSGGEAPTGADAQHQRRLLLFESFARRKHEGYVKWAYSRLMAWDDAREAANVALFRIFGRWDTALASENLDAFCFKILKDAVIDVLRARDRRPLPVVALEETCRPVAGISRDEADQAALRLDVHQAIEKLPGRQRTCVFLRDILGSPISEIADITGLAASTVRSHLKAGRTALAAVLGEGRPAKGNP